MKDDTQQGTMSGGKLIAEFLQKQETEYVFTLTGHTILGLYDALYDTPTDLIAVRHEQIAAHMGDGYFRTSHKPGIVATHVGPGLLNAATGVATAAFDSSAMVVISGDAPSLYEGAGPHQEMNMVTDMAQYLSYLPFAKRVWKVSHIENLERIMARAFSLATSMRPGPVLVDVPMQIFNEDTKYHDIFKELYKLNNRRLVPTDDNIEKALKLILNSERPLILVGGGARLSEAEESVLRFAELLNAPVVTTLNGKGVFPELHTNSLGYLGGWGNPSANNASLNSDLVIALGTRFGEVNSSSWVNGYSFDFSKSKLLRIDIDENESAKNYPEDYLLVGDIKATLDRIMEKLVNGGKKGNLTKTAWFETYRKDLDQYYDQFMGLKSETKFVRPDFIMKTLQEYVNTDDSVCLVTDVGWSKNGIAQYMRLNKPKNFITPGGFATMGFAPPASLGAKLGDEKLKVVCVVGDGGLTSTMSSIFTSKQYDIDVTYIVMNNYSFGTIQGLQRGYFDKRFTGTAFFNKKHEMYNPDFAGLAEATGIRNAKVERPSELFSTLKDFINDDEPGLIEIPTELQPDVPITGYWSITDLYKGKLAYMFDNRKDLHD